MNSVNKVILVGRLGADPEVRYTGSGTPVAHFRMATNETWTGKDGNKEERTEWHRIVAWGKLGEICGEYLGKGRQVFVEGKLRTNSWETKEGEKRYTTEITAANVVFLGGRGTSTGQEHEELPQPGTLSADNTQGQAENYSADEDVPF